MSTENYYVYQLRLPTSIFPFYVGKGKDNRWMHHFNEKKIYNQLKASIIKKAESDGIQIIVEKIADNIDNELACLCEVEAIGKYGRISNGTGCLTNLTTGGEGGNTLIDPLVRKKWESAMTEINNRTDVKKKRSDSAKETWRNVESRERHLAGRKARFSSEKWENDGRYVCQKRGWNQAKEKWLLAEYIYDVWLENDKCSYKKLSNSLVSVGFKMFHLQNMVKYFITKNPKTDPVYLEWKKEKEKENE